MQMGPVYQSRVYLIYICHCSHMTDFSFKGLRQASRPAMSTTHCYSMDGLSGTSHMLLYPPYSSRRGVCMNDLASSSPSVKRFGGVKGLVVGRQQRGFGPRSAAFVS